MTSSTSNLAQFQIVHMLLAEAERRGLSLTTADKIDCPQSSKEPKNED